MAKTDLVERTKAIISGDRVNVAAVRKHADDLIRAARLIDSAESGKGVLDQSEMLALLCKKLKDDTPTVNLIHQARFEVKARVGQFLPREKGGRGKENLSGGRQVLSPQMIADCRWLFDHRDQIESYFAGLGDEEASFPKFRSHVKSAVASEHSHGDDADRRDENDHIGKKPTPAALLAVKNSPLILLGPGWFVPGAGQTVLDELEEKGGWELSERLDSQGAFVVFRTLGLDAAADRAYHLRDRWRLSPLGWQVNVTGLNRFGLHASESLVIATHGRPQIPDALPKLDANEVRCPASGIESLIYSWFADFVGERGAPNLVIEIGGTERHKGYQLLTIDDLEAAAC